MCKNAKISFTQGKLETKRGSLSLTSLLILHSPPLEDGIYPISFAY
jgi:hypothetical protein